MHSSNFKFLDDLIHSGSKRISLDSDIVLESVEASNYIHGIKMDVDNLIMDGNGHTIDANHCVRIFSVTGKNILIKNLNFRNGYSFSRSEDEKKDGIFGNPILPRGYGGAIYNRGELELMNCTFLNNYSWSYGGAIANMSEGFLKINDCYFRDNGGYNGGAIFNRFDLEIKNSHFINNGGPIFSSFKGYLHRYDEITKFGGAILNENQLKIHNSIFNHNYARDGGAINNYRGRIKASKCLFSGNVSRYAGAVNNYDGQIEMDNSQFSHNYANKKWDASFDMFMALASELDSYNNKPGVDCGAVDNIGIFNLNNCRFIDNYGSTKSIKNRKDCFLNVNNSFFGDSWDNEIENEGDLKQNNCKFNFNCHGQN